MLSNESSAINMEINQYKVCNFTGIPLDSCYGFDGSHYVTFWIYFALRSIFAVTLYLFDNSGKSKKWLISDVNDSLLQCSGWNGVEKLQAV